MEITTRKINTIGNKAPKVHHIKFHTTKEVGAASAAAVSKQLEGGEEINQASALAYEVSRPVTKNVNASANVMKAYRVKQYQKTKSKMKANTKAKKEAKKATKRVTQNTAKYVAKSTTKKEMKKVTKDSVKTATKVAATAGITAAGTAVSPGVGTAITMAASYKAGVKVDQLDTKFSNRTRMLQYFKDKLSGSGEQRDSLALVLRDIIRNQILFGMKTMGPIIGLFMLGVVGVVLIVAMPILLVIAIIYNSPFAIFYPALEVGDTVQSVTSAYVQEFQEEVNDARNVFGYDETNVVYIDYEGIESIPSNYYDILGVYMVKYGVGDTATVMNEVSKARIKDMVDDMCSYTTRVEEESEVYLDSEGIEQTRIKQILYIDVHLKSYVDMTVEYDFTEEQKALIQEFMKPENLRLLGWTGGNVGAGGGNVVSLLSEDEIEAIVSEVSDATIKQALSFALSKVGYPYSQELRHSGTHYDCSSLVYYAYLEAGIDISYGGATTAAYECKGLEEAGKAVDRSQLQAGDLLFYSYANNGRYKNIGHVAMYVGNGKVVEAANPELGVIYRDMPSPASIVSVARPIK